jgi:class 3 adenylate cyclase
MYHEGGEQAFDAGNSIVDLQIRSAIAAPLLVGADVLGVVVLDTRHLRRAYDQDDLELVVSICHQIAVAIRNRQLLEQVEKQTRTRDNLRRFLPKPMADQVLAGEIDAGLGGKKYRGTVMFADVVGFTARSERTEPSELVRSMNVYFERVAPCVLAEGGSIDKFMGDAIMAVWGIPVALEDGGVRAVAAALRMQTRVAGLNATLDDPFGLGIGIHAGELVAGNIGTEERKEYTVLGDTVNTAQRLETIACVEQVIVSEVAWNDCRGKLFGIRMPPAELRNKSEPVVSFSVRGLVQSEAGEVELFLPIEVMDEEGVSRGHLIRRLADGTFLALLPRLDGVRPGSRVTSAAAEWSGVALATVESVAAAPPEAEDGGLIRCRLELSSPDLAGLLGEEALVALAATDSRLDRSDSLARWMAP